VSYMILIFYAAYHPSEVQCKIKEQTVSTTEEPPHDDGHGVSPQTVNVAFSLTAGPLCRVGNRYVVIETVNHHTYTSHSIGDQRCWPRPRMPCQMVKK
jgi:hypothetical protein